MDMSPDIKDLAIALAKVQAAIKPATKDATNPHFKSRYADLPAVWDACRKELSGNGLSVVQLPADAGEGRVGLKSILLHSSGQYIACEYSTRLQQDNAQGVGSALTYLRRYALAALVGIVADEDDDGNAASQPARNGGSSYEPRQAPQQQRPAQQAAPADAPVCEVHGTPMRVGKNGGHFCATKLADGTWCKARSAKPAPATSDEWDDIDAAAANRFRN